MALRATPSVQEYLALPYEVSIVSAEGGEWLARVDELPDCSARGRTPDEAERALKPVMEKWIGTALEAGREVPQPRAATSHSGRLLVRMPGTLHGELARAAEREGVSLNQFIVSALAAAVGWRRGESGGAARPRSLLLLANLVVVALAAAVAIVVLIVAWRHGW